jgi:hypothetical protein
MRGKFWYLFSSMILVSVMIVGTLLGLGGGANAINYGVPDGDGHPYVGIVAVYDDSGEFVTRGTGTLLSPTVVLTAGHVTSLAQYGYTSGYVRVSFESDLSQFIDPPDYDDPAWVALSHSGTAWTHPDYDPYWSDFPNTYDIGVVILDEPVEMDTYGELPEIGTLDSLATKRGRQERLFTTVGYGFQSIRPFLQIDVVRYKATSMLVNLRSALTDGYNLHTSNNPGRGQGTGGSCFGDSGGPVLLDDSNVVVAVVSFGNNDNCKGADFSYRTDIPTTQDFISDFLD